ncbi:MAG TPA: hypothetical protein PLA97_23645, partial [Rubrivivax sp.]|nr:hypothetical protein [Rubrivivax sp.]
MSPLAALLRTTWRGARVGVVGASLVGLGVLVGSALLLRGAWVRGQAPGLAAALGMPIFAGASAAMFGSLLGNLWAR